MTRAARVQHIAGWIIMVIGFVHLGVTFVDYDSLSMRALWFVGSGFALLLIGGLNVISATLPEQHFRELRSIRFLTLVSDACGLTLGLLFVALTSASQPQGPILVALFFIAALAQLSRSLSRSP
jgi:hypothetical protein